MLQPAGNNKEFICKITVLKRTLNNNWSKEFRNKDGQKCEVFTDGQEFIVDSPWSAPKDGRYPENETNQ